MIKVCKPTKPDAVHCVEIPKSVLHLWDKEKGSPGVASMVERLNDSLTCKSILISVYDSVEKRINVAACKVSAQVNGLTYYKTKPSIEEVL